MFLDKIDDILTTVVFYHTNSMSNHLLQIKVDPSLKEKLQRIALSKGLNVTSYIKFTLVEAAENDGDLALTENGFTVKEERRLLQSIKEGEKEYKKGKLKTYRSMTEAFKTLG